MVGAEGSGRCPGENSTQVRKRKGEVGCNRLVNLSRRVTDGGAEGCGTWGGGLIQKTVDNSGSGTILGCNNSNKS